VIVQPSKRFIFNPAPRIVCRRKRIGDLLRLTARHRNGHVVAVAVPPPLCVENDLRLPLALRLECIKRVYNMAISRSR
jgi:hypothetical protein